MKKLTQFKDTLNCPKVCTFLVKLKAPRVVGAYIHSYDCTGEIVEFFEVQDIPKVFV